MTKKQEIAYKEALAELETIMAKLEGDEVDIDELSGLVKRASELLTICRNKIYKAEKDVEKILLDLEKENLKEDE
jgi:exodeoxyribonuclease VII small subunit